MAVSTLGRNNAQGAVEVYQRGLLAGTWTPDDSRRILAMQDDPTELLGLMKTAATDPQIATALHAMEAAADAKFPPERPRPWARAVRTDGSPGQARDYHGRFAPGHGAAHDAARVEHVRREATAVGGEHVGDREAGKEHAAIANEHRALAAGHIALVPTARLAAYDAAHGKVQDRAGAAKATLDEHQARAARALATLRAHPEHGDLHDPTDAHEQASTHLGRVAGHHGETSYEAGHAEPTGPYREHAAAAQTALEELHGHQVRAAAELKQVDREHGRAAGAMQREAERHAETGVRIPENHPDHAAAQDAAESLSGHEAMRREDISGPMRTHLEDAHDALREAARSTAQTVRELAGITGRAPRLAKP